MPDKVMITSALQMAVEIIEKIMKRKGWEIKGS